MSADRSAISRHFEAYARQAPPASADLLRRCAADDAILGLLPALPSWDVPHRLTAAVDWLVDVGSIDDYRAATDPWAAFREAALGNAAFVRDFVRNQPVQTNEVQRCFALLPIFLAITRLAAGRPLDLIELGASAGLNLLFDRYRYRYLAGSWGPVSSELTLSGEERGTVPEQLLEQGAAIRRRLGIDLNPLDVRDEGDVRRLRVFAARHRHERLMRAVAVARRDPPELLRGDYLEVLPEVLAERDERVLTVVFQTLSAVYLDEPGRARLRGIIDEAGSRGALCYVWTPTPEEHGQHGDDYPIELAIWPGPRRRIVARMENHGEWLDWLGAEP